MKRLVVSAFVALAGLVAGNSPARADSVEVSGVHLCCGRCVQMATASVAKVDGISDVKGDRTNKKLTFTAKDEAAAKAARTALSDAGFFGTVKLDGKELAAEAAGTKKTEKAAEVTVKNAHICCGACKTAATKLFKDSKVEFPGTNTSSRSPEPTSTRPTSSKRCTRPDLAARSINCLRNPDSSKASARPVSRRFVRERPGRLKKRAAWSNNVLNLIPLSLETRFMLSAVGLRKSFGHIQAVDGVDLQLKPGESFGLLGPNGAGKTTTIHMLVGAIRPDSGTISIEGVSDPTRPEVRRFVGLAPQVESLYDELTGQENLTFFARLYGLAGDRLRERVTWGLELAGLTERRGDRVKAYSGGMKRRLNLACAMVHDPKVLFLDEPTAGVDPQSRSHLLASIEPLASAAPSFTRRITWRKLSGSAIAWRSWIMARFWPRRCRACSPSMAAWPPSRPTCAAGAGRSAAGTCDGTTSLPFARRVRGGGGCCGQGVQFASLHIERPNLETVFDSHRRRRLRD